jgi:hypothetical protein
MIQLLTIRKVFQFSISLYLIYPILGGNITAQELAEWHSFHGPERTNKSTETGLLSEWPQDGPGLVWTISGLGKGYSTVSIADGYLYTSGIKNQQTYVYAFDLGGEPGLGKTQRRILGNGNALGSFLQRCKKYSDLQ